MKRKKETLTEERKKEIEANKEYSIERGRKLILEHQHCYDNSNAENERRMEEIEYEIRLISFERTVKNIRKGNHQFELDSLLDAERKITAMEEEAGGKDEALKMARENTNRLLHGTPVEELEEMDDPITVYRIKMTTLTEDEVEKDVILKTFKNLDKAIIHFDKMKGQDGEPIPNCLSYTISLDEYECYNGENDDYADYVDTIDALPLFKTGYMETEEGSGRQYYYEAVWNGKKKDYDYTFIDEDKIM